MISYQPSPALLMTCTSSPFFREATGVPLALGPGRTFTPPAALVTLALPVFRLPPGADVPEPEVVVLVVVLGVVVLFYIGAMFGFFPFSLCDDLVIRAVAFCTLIICLVIAICTCFIIDFLDKK